ncbi:MAG TPA: isochorismatase family cysteine hydrolase [Alphaproteobacteria bacterium]|jgi:nicotinamidase-related amidase
MTAFDIARLKPATTALVLVDLQNDFLHPRGAYGRAGAVHPALAALPARVAAVAKAVRAWGGWTVATLFTLVPGRDGEPFVAPHLKALRPFLAKGDFVPGGWGQDVVDALKPVDFKVEKIAYSAFHQSRLEFVLKKAGVTTLIFTGIVTNGGVASTLRHAHVLEFETLLLSDGCAAFKPEVHETTVASLAAISPVATCAAFAAALARR